MVDTGYTREHELRLREMPDSSQIGKLLRGSFDMHVHFGPQPGLTRRQNALETALSAREMGLGGLVLKNHSYPTAALASLVSTLVPDISVFGSICLDYEVGGLNPHAVEAAAQLGAKVVWMPTFCARNSKTLVARVLGIDIKGDGISILKPNGRLVPEVDDILKIIKDHDMVLATGHISAPEILALVDRARQVGITKIVITHATLTLLSESILTPEQRRTLAREGVFIEHTAQEISPTGSSIDPAEVVAAIKDEGPGNCIMSSDFGGTPHPTIAEGMRLFISAMLKCGLNEEDVAHMVKLNPARLLGL